MLKAKVCDFFISEWLRNRNTVEFMDIWETVHKPDFNYGGFAAIKSKAGLSNYKLSAKEWVEQTNAIGLRAKTGRYAPPSLQRISPFQLGRETGEARIMAGQEDAMGDREGG